MWSLLSSLVLGYCWYRAAGEGVLDDQMIWLATGVIVVVVEMYVLCALISNGRRAVGLRRMRMVPDGVLHVRSSAAPRVVDVSAADVLAVAGSHRFHRRGCALTSDREAQTLSFHDAVSRGLHPCGICAEVEVSAR